MSKQNSKYKKNKIRLIILEGEAEKKIKKLMGHDHRGVGKPQITKMLLKKSDFWDTLIKYKSKNNSFREFLELVNPRL